jgi:hypothetical protein
MRHSIISWPSVAGPRVTRILVLRMRKIEEAKGVQARNLPPDYGETCS